MLELDPDDYRKGRVFQPIFSFRISCDGESPVTVDFDQPVSYGIRRCEFDTYLLRRSGARVREGVSVTSVERQDGSWIVNGAFRARMLVGAGGNFCPVARMVADRDAGAELVVAQESEFCIPASEETAEAIPAGTVELSFCKDLEGYGWIFRKQGVLNIGLGRTDSRNLPAHFSQFLKQHGYPAGTQSLPAGSVHGHAYRLWSGNSRRVEDALLLIGDAAGLAAAHSGEGIRPAIESGILAAKAIASAAPAYAASALSSYTAALTERLTEHNGAASALAGHLPPGLRKYLGRKLLRNQRFCREVVVKDWFCGNPQA